MGPFTRRVATCGGGLPRWIVFVANTADSQPARSATAVDLPAPSPPTIATSNPPPAGFFLGAPRTSLRVPQTIRRQILSTASPLRERRPCASSARWSCPAVRARNHTEVPGRTARRQRPNSSAGTYGRAAPRKPATRSRARPLAQPRQLAALGRREPALEHHHRVQRAMLRDHPEDEQDEFVLGAGTRSNGAGTASARYSGSMSSRKFFVV